MQELPKFQDFDPFANGALLLYANPEVDNLPTLIKMIRQKIDDKGYWLYGNTLKNASNEILLDALAVMSTPAYIQQQVMAAYVCALGEGIADVTREVKDVQELIFNLTYSIFITLYLRKTGWHPNYQNMHVTDGSKDLFKGITLDSIKGKGVNEISQILNEALF